MIGLTAMGARTQAIQAYEGFRVGLLDELGVEPDHRIGALYLQILRDSSAPAPGRADRDEVRTLLMLLRRALEADPGVLAGLPSMREVGQLLLARST
jgi:DNA-binding SARP family transcriptional activator